MTKLMNNKVEHLNYCRQFTKQALAMTAIPSLPELDHAKMLHALDLCRISQKFILPNGGHLLQDTELRALDETERLRLPHQFIALEYLATKENINEPDMTELCRRRIVFCREGDDGVYITPGICFDSNGMWNLMGECFIPGVDYLDRSNMLDGRVYLKTRWPRNQNPKDYYDEVAVALSFLNALACSNVHIERSEAKKSGKKIKAALPFDSYHILTIDIEKSGKSAALTSGGNHRSPREHLRRGHIVRPGEGRRPFWRNATVVCAGRGYHKVEKDYCIKASNHTVSTS